MPGGSVEHVNPEAGQVWLERAIRDLAALGLDQSDAAAAMDLFAIDRHDREDFRGPHVRA